MADQSEAVEDLRQQVADALLEINDKDPDAWLEVIDVMFGIVGPEMAELRARVEFEKHRGDTFAADWQFLNTQIMLQGRELKLAEMRREQAEAAISRMDALHQPKASNSVKPCDYHRIYTLADPREFRVCLNCVKTPIVVCTNITCCNFPCAVHLALHDETEETCAHG